MQIVYGYTALLHQPDSHRVVLIDLLIPPRPLIGQERSLRVYWCCRRPDHLRADLFQPIQNEFKIGPVHVNGDLYRGPIRIVSGVVNTVVPMCYIGYAQLIEPGEPCSLLQGDRASLLNFPALMRWSWPK